MHRFFLPPEHWTDDTVCLEGTEAHHARNVLRLKPGTTVAVFDGRGRELIGEILSIERDRLSLRRVRESLAPPLPCRITLAQAVPKARHMDLIVQKAVELGVAEIAPLISERTIVKAGQSKREKWQQIAIEAAKQCGQNWVPVVEQPKSVAEFLAEAPPDDFRLIGSLRPDAIPLKRALADRQRRGQATNKVLICIGPEGDFTTPELDVAFRYDCLPVNFGPIVLRVETAAIYCLSILSYELCQG